MRNYSHRRHVEFYMFQSYLLCISCILMWEYLIVSVNRSMIIYGKMIPCQLPYSVLFTVRCTQCQRSIAILCRPSVRPSVCPSVTLMYHGHMGWTSLKLITRIIGSLLLGAATSAVQSKGNTPKIRVKQEWGRSLRKPTISLKRGKIGPWLPLVGAYVCAGPRAYAAENRHVGKTRRRSIYSADTPDRHATCDSRHDLPPTNQPAKVTVPR